MNKERQERRMNKYLNDAIASLEALRKCAPPGDECRELSRDECERALMLKIAEAVEILRRYNTAAESLSVSYTAAGCGLSGYEYADKDWIAINNRYHGDGPDAEKPIDAYVFVRVGADGLTEALKHAKIKSM